MPDDDDDEDVDDAAGDETREDEDGPPHYCPVCDAGPFVAEASIQAHSHVHKDE